MKYRLLVILLFIFPCIAFTQTVQDPIRVMAAPGLTLCVWKVDLGHRGLTDLLIGYKATAAEIEEEKESLGPLYVPSAVGFAVFLRAENGDYFRCEGIERGNGVRDEGGITIDIARCYVGYIEEIDRYGIVSVEKSEAAPPSHHGLGVHKLQVYCYTIEAARRVRRIDLTPPFGISERHAIYDKYLSDAKRTKVQLEELAPERK